MNPEQILVVIPYFAKGAQGRELELAVAGWRKHFKTPNHLVIVGDHHPVVDSGADITFLPCPRIVWSEEDLDNYIPHLDHVRKFRAVREAFPDTPGFIYACDDMYAVKNFDIATVRCPKIVTKDMGGDIHHPNGWIRDRAKTRALCESHGLPLWNWVCHLPVYYEWDKLFAVYDKYGCDTDSYIVENIYFNTYVPEGEPLMIDESDPLRCWITNKQGDQDKLGNDFSGCVWCVNTPNGWSKGMEEALAKHYGL